MGVLCTKNSCLLVLSSLLFVFGMLNVIDALEDPIEDFESILTMKNSREKRQLYEEYEYELGYQCYNCSGYLHDCGQARNPGDDVMQCYADEVCLLTQQNMPDGNIYYYRYCNNPIYYKACSTVEGFACETFAGDYYCDECCNAHLCNSMQWTYGITEAPISNSTNGDFDSISSQTQKETGATELTYSSTSSAITNYETTTLVSKSSLESSTSASTNSSTSSSQQQSTSTSHVSSTSTSHVSSTNTSHVSSTNVSPESSTSLPLASTTSASTESSTSRLSNSSTSPTLVQSTSTSLAQSESTTEQSTVTTNKPLTGRMSCYKCTGNLIRCGLSRDPTSEKESCDGSISQCYVQWEVQPNGVDANYQRGCLSSSMVNFDVNILCPLGIMRGCKDNVCAMCCESDLCNDKLWIYSSALSQQANVVRWILAWSFIVALTNFFV